MTDVRPEIQPQIDPTFQTPEKSKTPQLRRRRTQSLPSSTIKPIVIDAKAQDAKILKTVKRQLAFLYVRNKNATKNKMLQALFSTPVDLKHIEAQHLDTMQQSFELEHITFCINELYADNKDDDADEKDGDTSPDQKTVKPKSITKITDKLLMEEKETIEQLRANFTYINFSLTKTIRRHAHAMLEQGFMYKNQEYSATLLAQGDGYNITKHNEALQGMLSAFLKKLLAQLTKHKTEIIKKDKAFQKQLTDEAKESTQLRTDINDILQAARVTNTKDAETVSTATPLHSAPSDYIERLMRVPLNLGVEEDKKKLADVAAEHKNLPALQTIFATATARNKAHNEQQRIPAAPLLSAISTASDGAREVKEDKDHKDKPEEESALPASSSSLVSSSSSSPSSPSTSMPASAAPAASPVDAPDYVDEKKNNREKEDKEKKDKDKASVADGGSSHSHTLISSSSSSKISDPVAELSQPQQGPKSKTTKFYRGADLFNNPQAELQAVVLFTQEVINKKRAYKQLTLRALCMDHFLTPILIRLQELKEDEPSINGCFQALHTFQNLHRTKHNYDTEQDGADLRVLISELKSFKNVIATQYRHGFFGLFGRDERRQFTQQIESLQAELETLLTSRSETKSDGTTHLVTGIDEKWTGHQLPALFTFPQETSQNPSHQVITASNRSPIHLEMIKAINSEDISILSNFITQQNSQFANDDKACNEFWAGQLHTKDSHGFTAVESAYDLSQQANQDYFDKLQYATQKLEMRFAPVFSYLNEKIKKYEGSADAAILQQKKANVELIKANITQLLYHATSIDNFVSGLLNYTKKLFDQRQDLDTELQTAHTLLTQKRSLKQSKTWDKLKQGLSFDNAQAAVRFFTAPAVAAAPDGQAGARPRPSGTLITPPVCFTPKK